MTPLFRPEAVDGQRQSWLGGVRLIRPLSLTLLTSFAVSVAALVFTGLLVGEYTRKAHISGVLVADRGWVGVGVPQQSQVIEVLATGGQVVQRDDVLFVVSTDATPSGAGTLERVLVRAPQDGVVVAVRAVPGQRLAPSAVMASLAPAQVRLQAQFYAPSSAIGYLRPDQPVLLRYPAFPPQQFGHFPGRVLQVSRTPLVASELPAAGARGTGSTADEPLYRIAVALDAQSVQANGQVLALAAGMQVETDVPLERRRLIEWLFDPVRALAGRA